MVTEILNQQGKRVKIKKEFFVKWSNHKNIIFSKLMKRHKDLGLVDGDFSRDRLVDCPDGSFKLVVNIPRIGESIEMEIFKDQFELMK